MHAEKPDLLAYLEQRLSAADRDEVEALLKKSAPLRQELASLRSSFEIISKAADQARNACEDNAALARMTDHILGGIDEEPLPPLPEESLELPNDLKKAVASRRRAILSGKVAKSMGVVGRMGAEKARDLAGKLTSAMPQPDAAMAIRDDATEVDDQANGSDEGQNGDDGEREL